MKFKYIHKESTQDQRAVIVNTDIPLKQCFTYCPNSIFHVIVNKVKEFLTCILIH